MKFLLLIISIVSLAGCATTPRGGLGTVDVRTGEGTYHEVRPGETLWKISRLYDIDLKTLARVNSIKDTSELASGQKIFVPGAVKKKKRSEDFSIKDSFVWPVEGAIISHFGTKLDMVKNKGLDIKTSSGGDVRASRSGKVVFRSDAFEGFGKTIIIDHDDGYQTVYAYNSRLLADVGDWVAQNDVIAKVGKTGRAKTQALHFEIRKDGEPENPLDYLPR